MKFHARWVVMLENFCRKAEIQNWIWLLVLPTRLIGVLVTLLMAFGPPMKNKTLLATTRRLTRPRARRMPMESFVRCWRLQIKWDALHARPASELLPQIDWRARMTVLVNTTKVFRACRRRFRSAVFRRGFDSCSR